MKNYRAIAWLAAAILFAGATAGEAATFSAGPVINSQVGTWMMTAAGLCLTGFGTCRKS